VGEEKEMSHNCSPTDPILRLAGYYYQCDYCGDLFKSLTACKAHLPSEPPTVYECTRCAPCSYGDFPNCVTRTSEISQTDACSKAQARADELLALHMETVHPIQYFECKQCVKCPNCQTEFCETRQSANSQEEACERALTAADLALAAHMKTCLAQFCCTQCTLCFGTQEMLDRHIALAHPEEAVTHALRCYYYNVAGFSEAAILSAVETVVVPLVNPIIQPLGYDYVRVDASNGYMPQWGKGYFDILYKARGTPAIPIGLILTTIIVAIAGIVIFWCAWVYLETNRMEAESKKSLDDLLREGYIDKETWERLRAAEQEDWWDKLMGMMPMLLIVLMVASIAGALPRRKD